MSGALRIALAYFSGTPLMSWMSLIGSVVVGAGLLCAALVRNASLASIAMNFAQFGILALIIGPAYNGGVWLRSASTPGIMHLRPHGRRQMLLGAVMAITLTAALMTLPAAIDAISPLAIPRGIPFDQPLASQIRFSWGLTALLWVATFALSSRRMLLAFSWVPLFAGLMFWDWLSAELRFTRGQFASLLFAGGIAAWITFAFWYLKAPNVLRRELLSANVGDLPQLDLARLDPGRWFRRSGASDARASSTTAVRQYLVGAYSARNCLLIGAAIAALLAILHLVFNDAGQPPLSAILMTPALYGALYGGGCVSRARMLWLRAGQDRAALFVTAEHFALQVTALLAAIPVAVFVIDAVIQQPSVAASIILHAATQMAFATCAVYAGITYTRGAPQIFGLFVVLGLPSLVALVKLEPHTVTSPWPHIGALLLFSALALLLRGIARRSWLRLDWRLVGPPLSSALR
ncbi:MAG: hypothetical protein ABI645_14850 [Pseudomonadota bacterium]